jgi:hypothetical protein
MVLFFRNDEVLRGEMAFLDQGLWRAFSRSFNRNPANELFFKVFFFPPNFLLYFGKGKFGGTKIYFANE